MWILCIASALSQAQAADPSKPIPGLPAQARYDAQGEVTVIGQSLFKFRSRYASTNSLPAGGRIEATETATLYLGARPIPNVEVYANPEVAWGSAAGAGNGLAGYLNGDLIGQPTTNSAPYLARTMIRWRIPVRQGKDQPVGHDDIGRAPNIIAGPIPQHRLVITAGRLSPNDSFDVSNYANNPRTQFLNNAFTNSLTYDYPQDVRGYTYGAVVALKNPTSAIRFGTYAVPTNPGSHDLSYNLANDHSESLELQYSPQILKNPKPPLTVRLLGFRNVGRMGSYSSALSQSPLNLSSVRDEGSVRCGMGLSLEQGLADGGATGIFTRIGFANGNLETQSYAEADEAVSVGGNLAGTKWKRKDDILGLALGASAISGKHQQYLSNGGQGFTLGDGRLSYSPEKQIEAFYMCQLSKGWQLTADLQYIVAPGYNSDRGPAPVLGFRAHFSF